MPRFFTLIEAETLLPEVERLLRNLIDLKHDYMEADSSLAAIGHRISMAGGMVPPRDEVILLNRRKEGSARSLQTSAKRIEDFGVQVKDLDTGLIDFPTLYRGQEVYLCWKLGEPSIAFWHHIDDGFRGRRPIDSEFLSNHKGSE